MKIVVTPTSFQSASNKEAVELLEKFADEIVYNPYGRPLDGNEIISLTAGADGVIAGLDTFDRETLSRAPASLKVISRFGVGCDRVDLACAREKGIIVTNTPGVNSQAVADLAFGLMLSVARSIPALHRQVIGGGWPRYTGTELYGKTLGILGLGAIGKAVSVRGKGFSMRILAYDPFFDESFAVKHGVEQASFNQVIEESDFISIHLPLNEQTQNCISREAIGRMKDGAILVNTARGGIIDESAAYDALLSGKLGGLGLDAFNREPPVSNPLFTLDNVVATPHTGAHTREAVSGMGILSVQNLIQVLRHQDCPNRVN